MGHYDECRDAGSSWASVMSDDNMELWRRHREQSADRSTRHAPLCKRCGSTDVRWRQQGGRWVLFSLTPGVAHRCANVDASEDFK